MKIEDLELGKKYVAVNNNTGEKVKIGLCYNSAESIFIYAKGKKNRGWQVSKRYFVENYTLKESRATDKSKWEHNVDRVIKTLEKSGLWADILETYRNLKTLGYDEKNRIYDEYDKVERHDWKDGECYNTAEYDNWLCELEKKYPFLIGCDEKGRKYLKTSYIWELSRAKLKSMYFGKYHNEAYKNEIANCLTEKKKINFATRTNYDVSFEYNAELGKAWYSEEYKGCGNGHYYLALDNNLALFCEDD